jgi:hypothetical protein
VEQLEERRELLAHVTEDWLSLLREMESNGETSDPRYDRYFQAYLEARAQVNRVELELFNRRQGLVT